VLTLNFLQNLKKEIFEELKFIEEYGINYGEKIFKERLYLYQGCGGFAYNGFSIFSTNWSLNMNHLHNLIVNTFKIQCNGAMITCYYPSIQTNINKARKKKR